MVPSALQRLKGKSWILHSGERWSEIGWSQQIPSPSAQSCPLPPSRLMVCHPWFRFSTGASTISVAKVGISYFIGKAARSRGWCWSGLLHHFLHFPQWDTLVSSSFEWNAMLLIFGWLPRSTSLWVSQWGALRNSLTSSLELVSTPIWLPQARSQWTCWGPWWARRLGPLSPSSASVIAVPSSVVISITTMKRPCWKPHMFRRKNHSSLKEVANFVLAEIVGNRQMQGYQLLHPWAIQSIYVVLQDTIRQLNKLFDPEGVEFRCRQCLRLSYYYNQGPYVPWCMESYDKVKIYGIAISCCTDGFSQYVVWMEA